MTLRIDWETYEVIEMEDYTHWELEDTIEDVVDEMDRLALNYGTCQPLEDLYEELVKMQEEIENDIED